MNPWSHSLALMAAMRSARGLATPRPAGLAWGSSSTGLSHFVGLCSPDMPRETKPSGGLCGVCGSSGRPAVPGEWGHFAQTHSLVQRGGRVTGPFCWDVGSNGWRFVWWGRAVFASQKWPFQNLFLLFVEGTLRSINGNKVKKSWNSNQHHTSLHEFHMQIYTLFQIMPRCDYVALRGIALQNRTYNLHK